MQEMKMSLVKEVKEEITTWYDKPTTWQEVVVQLYIDKDFQEWLEIEDV